MDKGLFENIEDIDIEQSLKNSYLDYSMSVIVGRALPDARDGLKPVHRRILYAMNDLGVTAKSNYKKSARIVGDTIGKYHPHGDNAVYDALVRLAQDFSMREQLIDGQGNFGSIDGDNAAAMRYTEARMKAISEDILKDIDKDTVDFTANYDDSMLEPDVLPSRVPNLLLNGSSGIAVGMATNIPPHNLSELIDALLYLIDNKECNFKELLNFINGPDFPTGGIIFGKQGILNAYESGRGRIKVRAKTHIEEKKNRDVIIIDELPFQVNKSRLIEQIANLVRDKQIEGISEVRDESDREGIRVVIELKKDSISDVILNNLFKSTNLEITFGIIIIAIENKEPKLFNLKALLDLFLKHRKTVIIRRSIFELNKAKKRAHILEGLKIALESIDNIIRVIKSSSNTVDAKENLMREFSLSEIQSSSILDMKLNKLTSLEIEKIDGEFQTLQLEIAKLEAILKSESELNKIIKSELVEVKEKYQSPRKTEIVDDYDEIDIKDLIANDTMVVTITHRGYIKRVPQSTYEKQHRGGKGKTALTTYEDDFIESFFISNNHDTLMFVTDKGKLYWLEVYRIPEASRIAKGKAIVNLINLEADENIKAIIPTVDFANNKSLAFFTKNGVVKRTNLNEFSNIRSNGVKAIVLDESDELVTAKILEEDAKEVFIVTQNGVGIRFPIDNIREQGRATRGVRGIKFKHDNDIVVGATIINSEENEILTVSEKGLAKKTKVKEYRLQSRAGSGIIAMKLNKKTGNLLGIINIDEENLDLMALTAKGKMIRISSDAIRSTGRATSGVKIINLSDDFLKAIAKCYQDKEEIVSQES